MDEIFAQYYEDLLRAQYRVSEVIQQNLPINNESHDAKASVNSY